MRKPFVAGNWKMNKTIGEAVELVQCLAMELRGVTGCDVAVCPPTVALSAVHQALSGSAIKVGAQNMYFEEKGAFTGEVSPLMLAGLCEYVIIGHSERRNIFGETDDMVNQKIKAALAHRFKPIVCVGENLEQNRAGDTEAFVGSQVRAALADVSPEQARIITVAYEPIWAIGTGVSATGEGANEIIRRAVRDVLAELYGKEIAETVRVQYGGSANPGNIAEFMSQPDIDGALVGGASLKVADFAEIVKKGLAAKSN